MNTSVAGEISDYLKHGDYSVAVRRTLDYCLDTGDDTLIETAISWSREYHENENSKSEKPLPDNFIGKAESILQQAKTITGTASVSNYPLISAEKISKTYSGGNFSLKPIDLSIGTGNVLGVVGENGNGKTTLLRCLAGQLALDNGEIKYHLLQQPDAYAIKNHIAFIPQRIPKWYGLLKDNLHFSASIAGVYGAKNNLMVNFMLERLNLSSYAHLTWNQISSGYRTRFEIARILLQKPRLLILDEPLANLDINAQQTILTDLIFMAKGTHNPMGIILSSQQLHEVEKVADTVIFIKQGNCLYSSNDKAEKITSNAIEFETATSRESIVELFGEGTIELQFNGGFYTIISSALSAQEIIGRMITANIPVTYFRDITYSTKRFF
ncbi:ATP-binding cassette domain-containing protein [Ferruginibacter sp. SUN106]|uniref:ABC transporter ATP-binding protein n=1 Tax=Ferruginibacter sp. SUN106 TaxID=2978348 RepID=UPI003D3663FE